MHKWNLLLNLNAYDPKRLETHGKLRSKVLP